MAHLYVAPTVDSKSITVPVVDAPQTGRRHKAARDRRATLVLTGQAPTNPVDCAPDTGMPLGVLKRQDWQQRHSMNLLVTDTLVVCAGVVLAQYVRFGHAPTSPGFAVWGYSALLIVLWLSALAVLRTRSPRVVANGTDEYRRVVAACFWTFGAVAMVGFLLKLEIARGYLAVALPVGGLGLLLARYIWREHVACKRAGGGCRTAVLAIGETDMVANLAKELTQNPKDGYHVVGVCIPGFGAPNGEHLIVDDRAIPIVGGETYALESIRAYGADTIAIAGTRQFDLSGIRKLVWALEPMNVDLLVSPGVIDVASSRMVMRSIAGLPLLHIEKPRYRDAVRFAKSAFDVVFALAALAGTLPLLLLASLAIKLTSRGPVFYASERIGIDGKPFRMLKFRTMVVDADKQLENLQNQNECNGPLFKIRDDPRVTPVGKILRRFSIDELPQFLNVVRMEMSVVGPRPPLLCEVETYDADVLRRLLVKPGVTGLWQVSGRSDLPWDTAVRLDLSYVDNWSMYGDLVIIARTLRAVLKHTGAY
jgi:exopolysaccharide biosynthesis polyprenyl glycosylphosphotransferase